MELQRLIDRAHGTAVEKGWWEKGDRDFGEQVANFHGEVSEAWEEYRVHGLNPEKFIYFGPTGKPEGIAVEFADILIRVFDTCAQYGIPLEEALDVKMDYNDKRPYRHGGKLA